MNSVAEIKSGLHHYIAKTEDIEVLTKLQKYVELLLKDDNSIIAYTSEGKPLTQKAYKAEIDSAIKESETGEILSVEEMEEDL